MKGQFFIFGAIVMVLLFFLGIPYIRPILSSPGEDLSYLSKNIKAEFPAAFNIGLNESNADQILQNFTRFLDQTLSDYDIEFRALWAFSVNQSTDVNITVGNFLNSNTTVSMSTVFSGTTIDEDVFVQADRSNSTLLQNAESAFNITFEFESGSKEVEWVLNKANIYLWYELMRGNLLLRDEITG